VSKFINKVLAVSLFAGLTHNTVVVAQIPFGPISGDADKGQEQYYQHGCYGCHGYTGIGKRNLANDVSALMSNEQLFLNYLRARDDLNPSLPTQKMPSYSQQTISDEKALDIYAYIRTFKDAPPETIDIPALNLILEDAKERTE
jgi:cytochrome c